MTENAIAQETVTPLVAPVLPIETPELEQSETRPVLNVQDDGKGGDPVKAIHPLEPGGVRFNQIYARAKAAEAQADVEREARIRAEAERDLYKQAPSVTPQPAPVKEYTNADLEGMIATGQATREQVDEYKEKRLEQRLAQKLRAELDASRKDDDRTISLSREIGIYTTAIPNVAVAGTPERTKIDAEYQWLVRTHNIDLAKLTTADRQGLLLNACRNVFGPVDAFSKSSGPTVEVHRGSIGGEKPVQTENPDQKLLDGLSKQQVAHYERMMKAGRYRGGWKEVVEELKYVPPPVASGNVRR